MVCVMKAEIRGEEWAVVVLDYQGHRLDAWVGGQHQPASIVSQALDKIVSPKEDLCGLASACVRVCGSPARCRHMTEVAPHQPTP